MCVRAHECVGAWSVLPVACPVAGVRRVGCHCRGHKACLAHTAGVCVSHACAQYVYVHSAHASVKMCVHSAVRAPRRHMGSVPQCGAFW